MTAVERTRCAFLIETAVRTSDVRSGGESTGGFPCRTEDPKPTTTYENVRIVSPEVSFVEPAGGVPAMAQAARQPVRRVDAPYDGRIDHNPQGPRPAAGTPPAGTAMPGLRAADHQ
jgi:hypothetical protein